MKAVKTQSEQFVDALVAAFCKFPENIELRASRRIYAEKLGKWRLSGEQWTQALDRIIAVWDKNELPPLAVIYPVLKIVIAEAAAAIGNHWMLFTLNGERYTVKVSDPEKLPTLPEHATDIHLCIDPKKQARDNSPITGHEARAAFAQGFLEAGGDKDQLNVIFRSLTAPEKPKRESHKSEFTDVAKGAS